MTETSDGLKDGEPEVNLGRAQHIDAPLAIMIPELLVKVMEHLRSEESTGTGQGNITEKRFMNPIQTEFLCFTKVCFNITRVSV